MLHFARQLDPLPVQILNRVLECRTIALLEDIRPDLDNIIRPQSDEELIEYRMVKAAQSDAVADNRLALRLSVRNNMGGVKQFLMTKAAKSALPTIRFKHPFAESPLVEPNAYRRREVGSPGGIRVLSYS